MTKATCETSTRCHRASICDDATKRAQTKEHIIRLHAMVLTTNSITGASFSCAGLLLFDPPTQHVACSALFVAHRPLSIVFTPQDGIRVSRVMLVGTLRSNSTDSDESLGFLFGILVLHHTFETRERNPGIQFRVSLRHHLLCTLLPGKLTHHSSNPGSRGLLTPVFDIAHLRRKCTTVY